MKIYAMLCLLLTVTAAFPQSSFLLLGTYTKTGSKGIYVYRFNSATAETKLLGTADASNPSFLTVTREKQFVYAVNEDDTGMVSAYRFDTATGALRFLNSQPSNGRHPCYITTDWRGIYVFAGNYSSGNFSVFRTSSDGSLQPAHTTVQHYGGSIHPQRQQAPHVHATIFGPGNHQLFVPDLGADRVFQYRFYWKDGLKDTVAWRSFKATPGSGPRHLSFHPGLPVTYLMEELSGTVSVLKMKKNGRLKQIQRISSHPAAYNGVKGSADIHVSPDGKFLYASNRGESNTLAIFSIGRRGKLTPAGHQSTLGLKPRNFNFDPTSRYLLVANQDTNEVVIFERNTATGLLTDTGKRIQAPSPVCVAWAG